MPDKDGFSTNNELFPDCHNCFVTCQIFGIGNSLVLVFPQERWTCFNYLQVLQVLHMKQEFFIYTTKCPASDKRRVKQLSCAIALRQHGNKPQAPFYHQEENSRRKSKWIQILQWGRQFHSRSTGYLFTWEYAFHKPACCFVANYPGLYVSVIL